MTTPRVYVFSPLTYKEFKPYFHENFPAERLLYEQHQHRYDMFVDFMGWRSKNIFRDEERGIEYDAYDRENSIYSIIVDVDNDYEFLGCTRAASTTHPYMLQTKEFEGTCYPGVTLPQDPEIFEGTRIISPNSKLYQGTRKTKNIKVATPLLFSHMELGRVMGIKGYVGTMPPTLLEKSYGRMGWEHKPLGPPSQITDDAGHDLDNGALTQNYYVEVSEEMEQKIRQTTGINTRISDFGVSDDVLPDLLAHMREHIDLTHLHRELTDLSTAQQTTKLEVKTP